MRLFFFYLSVLISFVVCSQKQIYAVASSGPAYVVGGDDTTLYSLNLETGDYVPVTQIVDTDVFVLSGAALANSSTAYVLAFYGGLSEFGIYSVNLTNGSYKLVTPERIPCGQAVGIALGNSTTAYVTDSYENTIKSVNLITGKASLVTTLSLMEPELWSIAIGNNNTAYVTSQLEGNIYSVNLKTGAYQLVTPIPVGPPSPYYASLQGIALANSNTAYVVGSVDNNAYVVDLTTGAFQLVTATSIGSPAPPGSPSIVGLALNETTGYTVGQVDNNVYAFNLQTGESYLVTSITGSPGLYGVALLLQMQSAGLTSNNLNLASYLNANAPVNVIRSFALLPDHLSAALESAAPTRNTFATYASQNGYLAASQALSDHGRQKRFQNRMHHQKPTVSRNLPEKRLFVDAADAVQEESVPSHQEIVQPSTTASTPPDEEASSSVHDSESIPVDTNQSDMENAPFVKESPQEMLRYNVWAAPFGEYAKEKEQHQTPAFSLTSGGLVVGCDFNGEEGNLVGFGGAYVYTHLHEDNNQGHANLNQGYLTVYGTAYAGKWYFDLGLWGGYYNALNQRNIQFPGVSETAKTRIQGWQLAPHFEMGYDGFWLSNGVLEWFGLEPFLMLDWVANWEQNAKEWGAGDFNMGQNGRFCSLLRSESGLRFHEILRFDWGLITFREKGSYAYQKAFGTGSLNAFLLGSAGSFTVNTLTAAQNLGVFEFAMLFAFENRYTPYVDVRYQGEFGSKYQSHQGVIELGKNF